VWTSRPALEMESIGFEGSRESLLIWDLSIPPGENLVGSGYGLPGLYPFGLERWEVG
jgi:hypothetical protein